MNIKGVSNRVAALLTATIAFTLVGCATSRYERTTGEYVDDQMLNRRVHHALNAQPVYKFPDVQVHSFRGVVQLSGFVATEAQKEAAGEIAQRVRGVGELENAISLAPLDNMALRNFIPGRDVNDTNRATGAPSIVVGRSSGTMSSTNQVRGTNTIVR